MRQRKKAQGTNLGPSFVDVGYVGREKAPASRRSVRTAIPRMSAARQPVATSRRVRIVPLGLLRLGQLRPRDSSRGFLTNVRYSLASVCDVAVPACDLVRR